MSKIINYANLDMKILSNKTDEIILFLIIAYFAGHFVSVFAEILFENIIYDLVIRKIKILTFKAKLSENIIKEVERKYESKFGSKLDIIKDKQYLVIYTEENHPNVYSTAFVFLTFLGLGRNMALILFSMTILSSAECIFKIRLGIFGIVFLLQFILFKVYFESHILSAYILSENKESKEMEE